MGKLTRLNRVELQDMIAKAGYGEGKVKLNLCGYDLTGVDLSYLDLSEVRLLHCTLNEIELYCTNMSGALLEECIIDNLDRASVESSRSNFNGLRFLYHKNSEALQGALAVYQKSLLQYPRPKTIKDKLVSWGTLRFFQGATVVYWDKKAGMYLSHVVPLRLQDGDEDEDGYLPY